MEELESTSRPRIDSVTDQVDAKLMAESTISSTTTGPRVKRVHRMSNTNNNHASTTMNIDSPEEEEEGLASTTMNTAKNTNASGPSC
jgi:hypothetical protein